MSMGPVEVLMVTFPGDRFTGQLAPALTDLVDQGLIRIIDLLFVRKDNEGNVTTFELEQLKGTDAAPIAEVEGEVGSLLTADDIDEAVQQMPLNSAGAMLVWENVWAARFAAALRDANGEVKLNIRIPHAVVEAALARESTTT